MRDPESIIGNSPALTRALEHLSQLAPVNRPVLVLGERGTGKELAAQRLHFLSSRWEQPLLKVNCAAMAENLLESELFGHEKGAFTGATGTHIGRFERADNGTLFLDELGTMSSRLQEKLLRLVEYGEFERLGSSKTIRVDVRIIGATNIDLPSAADNGEFRHDLLDRLAFDVITVPPLRHRRDDIMLLAEHFGRAMAHELDWPLFPGFTHDIITQMQSYDWPGNIRELKNTVERAVYHAWDGEQPIERIILDPFDSPWRPKATHKSNLQTSRQNDHEKISNDHEKISNVSDIRAYIAKTEKDILQNTLQKHNHHQGNTAAALALSYDQLRHLLKKHHLLTRAESTN